MTSPLYLPKNFTTQELVAPEIYALVGELALNLLDPELLMMIDRLRSKYGPIVINNYATGGRFTDSGLRSQTSKVGAPKSAHKLGLAFDLKFVAPKVTPTAVCADILKNPSYYPWIKRIENPLVTKTWLHIDAIAHGKQGIYVFNP